MISSCYSGGAKGADTLFGQCANKAGHVVAHFHFDEQKKYQKDFFILTQEQLDGSDPYILKANETLKRGNFSAYDKYVKNLIRRNYVQVACADSLYAVAWLDPYSNSVLGGTGWAVQMFIDQKAHLPCFVYCMEEEGWFKWDKRTQEWLPVAKDQIPKPQGDYAGIGSRDLTPNGKQAILDLYKE